MKSLKPSARENKRYILVSGAKNDIEKAILEFTGVLGMSKCGLSFISSAKNKTIICVNRESVNLIRASFAVSKNLSAEKVSGTLKGLKK